jgi:WD40 repeat protein
VGGADDGGVMVWEAQSGELVARLPSVRAHVRWLDAGRTLRVVGTVVEDWLLPPRSPWPHVHVSAEGVAAVAVAPDGRLIASAHGDGHVRVARVDREGFVYDLALHDSVTKDVAFSPDGAYIAVICAGRPQVVVLDAATGAEVRTLDSLNARSLVWLREGILITPYAGGLQWWADPLRGGDPVSIGALARAHDLQPWPDRRGAALLDAKAVLWEIVGTELPSVRRVSEGAETGSIMSDGVQQVSLRGDVLVHRDPHGVERSVRADGGMPLWVTADAGFQRAAIGHQDGTVRVWSLPDLALRAVLRGHTSRTLALAFSADGRFLVTGSWDGDVRVWSMRPLELSADALVEEAVGAWGRTAHDLLGLRAEL